ncbi:hypothetical protein L1987_44768 [Smallanthus sonchifolius]|uniref:Uncharacterized protein n=1 Tax=Smallanthus sonchifolius TaxID=185202 RepID=A0ACB9GQC7_9ASTR|nr:hypothetical protein L1987_44768 [Smallanthus sonchifolius]
MRMKRILERYERHSSQMQHTTSATNESQDIRTLGNVKLKARLELLQKTQRHLMGEELDSLSLKELHTYEQQIDAALRHIRLRKNQLMLESISLLQKKDKELQDQNNLLSKQISEKQKELEQQTHERIPSFVLSNSDRYQSGGGGGDGEVEENPREGQPSTVMPPWMVQYINK